LKAKVLIGNRFRIIYVYSVEKGANKKLMGKNG